MNKRFIAIVACLSLSVAGKAQINAETPEVAHTEIQSAKEFIEKSNWHFHSRTYAMSTINEAQLKDDFTIAQGAGIGLITAPFKGFQLGVSGYFIFNLLSSDLAKPDATTGGMNRYEIGQYDVQDFENKSDLDRLEDLYLRYTYGKHSVVLGRMELETPFMNMQDGRMRPTVEEGLWYTYRSGKKWTLDAGIITGVSPRSTVSWFGMAESIGLYGQGVTTDGNKSNYKGNLESKGLMMFHAGFKPSGNWNLHFWNGYLENILNTSLFEIKHEVRLPNSSLNTYQGFMLIRQIAVNDGGNGNPALTYINRGAASTVISAQAGIRNKRLNWNLNYTRITKEGRYLMPREWGRDPFYTFMPRERNEGSGDLNAFSTQFQYLFPKQRLKTGLGYGYYRLPSVQHAKLNKYGMPSYHQLNVNATYTFNGFWKGADLRFLAASKMQDSREELNAKYVYNKVNLINFNLILDIKL